MSPFDGAVPPATTGGVRGFARHFAGLAGPGVLVAVGYMDPGNWVTDIAGDSRYG